jgi:hypothetical protein
MSLEYFEWIDYAVEHKLLLSEQDFQDMQPNQNLDFFKLDQMYFNISEYPERYDLKYDVVYDPKTFFDHIQRQQLKVLVAPTGNRYIKKVAVMTPDRKARLSDELAYQIYDHSYGHRYDIYIDENNNMTVGSGDFYTRFMPWENLSKMPNFYFVKD